MIKKQNFHQIDCCYIKINNNSKSGLARNLPFHNAYFIVKVYSKFTKHHYRVRGLKKEKNLYYHYLPIFQK